MHGLDGIVAALMAAGLRLDRLHEHDAVPRRMVSRLEEAPGGMHRWPDRPWLPLAFSLSATRA